MTKSSKSVVHTSMSTRTGKDDGAMPSSNVGVSVSAPKSREDNNLAAQAAAIAEARRSMARKSQATAITNAAPSLPLWAVAAGAKTHINQIKKDRSSATDVPPAGHAPAVVENNHPNPAAQAWHSRNSGVLPRDLTLTMQEVVSNSGGVPDVPHNNSLTSSASSTLSTSTASVMSTDRQSVAVPSNDTVALPEPAATSRSDQKPTSSAAATTSSATSAHVQMPIPRTWTWTEHFDKNTKRMYVPAPLRESAVFLPI